MPRARKFLIMLFVIYAAWSVIAVTEIVLRKVNGTSTLPGILANHNGNLAISGFILFSAYPGALLAALGSRRKRAWLSVCAQVVVPLSGLLWGLYFILMEVTPLLGSNTLDPWDIPASVFGMVCGTVFGALFQRRLLADWGTGRRASS